MSLPSKPTVTVTIDGIDREVTVDGFGEATDGAPFATARDATGTDYELWGDGIAERIALYSDAAERGRWKESA